MLSKSFHKLLLVKLKNMFNKSFRNHGIIYKLLLIELENKFNKQHLKHFVTHYHLNIALVSEIPPNPPCCENFIFYP